MIQAKPQPARGDCVFLSLFLFFFFFLTNDDLPSVEVKVLKSRVRNVIAPNRDLGHTDRALKKDEQQDAEKQTELQEENKMKKKEKDCEDCL